VLEALVADQAHRLHQGARGVAQQDPVDRIVNVGLYAGGIQEIGFQVQRLVQVQHTGLALALLEQELDGLLDLGQIRPLGIALEEAFAGDADAVQFGQAAEPLEQGTVGQAGGETAKAFAQEGAGEVAAQGPAGVDLVVALGFGGGRAPGELRALEPLLDTLLEELLFQAALDQQFVDALQLPAELLVIDIALDGGQGGLERQGKRNEYETGHEARLYSSL